MTTYSAPIKDQQFILHEVLRLSQSNIPGYGDLDPAFTEAIFNESGKLASAVIAPLNAIGDRKGCTWNAGAVHTPAGFKTPHNALAGSTEFLHLLGHFCLGLMWGEIAKAACAALETNPQDRAYYETKLTTGKYYMTRQLPATALHLARITSGGDTLMALDVGTFSD